MSRVVAWAECAETILGRGFLDPEESRWSLHRVLVLFAFGLNCLAGIMFSGGDPKRLLVPEVVPFLVGAVLIVPLVLRERSWTYLLAGIGVVLMPIIVLVETEGGELLEPAATIGFVSNLLLLAAIVIGLASGLYGFLEMRKGMRLVLAKRALRTRHGRVALATVALLVGASVTSFIAGGHAGADIAGAGAGYDIRPAATITLIADGSFFSPSRLEVPAGKPTEIAFDNTDTLLHRIDYEVNGTKYSHEVFPGGKTKFLVLFDEAGTIPFVCKFHKSSMTGEFVVA